MYNILHLEDDEEYATIFQMHMHRKSRPHNITLSFDTVSDIESALGCCKKKNYDCIICDCQLSERSGIEFVKEFRNGGNSTPIIFLTGQGDESIAREAFVSGANDYYTKDAAFAGYDRFLNAILTHVRYYAVEKQGIRTKSMLETKERLADTYFNIVDVIILAMDRNGTILNINEYGSRTLGIMPKEGKRINFIEKFIHDRHLGRFTEKLEEALESATCGKEISFELPICIDGKELTLLWNMSPNPVGGSIDSVVCAGKDISERVNSEKLLRLEHDKFLSVLESLKIGVYIVDKNFNIEYANPFMVALFGTPPKEMKCYAYLHGRSSPCPECPNDQVFCGKTLERANYYPSVDRTFLLSELPIFNSDGTVSKLELFYPKDDFANVSYNR